MTAPAPLDQDVLAVLVGPAALTYHDALDEELQVDLDVSYRVHGDVRLVAADLLSASATAARRAAAQAAAPLKAFRVEGEYSEEYFSPQSAPAGDAAEWEARATRLRAEVGRAARPYPRSVVVSVEPGW